MDLKKIVWVLRAKIWAPFYGKMGKSCYIGKPLSIIQKKNIFLNNNVHIYPGARIETYGEGRVIFEENVSIGQNFHLTTGGDKLVIGKGTLITGNVFITNIEHPYEDITKSISEQGHMYKTTNIGRNCFIGFGVGIQAGSTLGDHCIVGANAIVKGDFPAYSVIVGSPAKVVKMFNFDLGKWEKV